MDRTSWTWTTSCSIVIADSDIADFESRHADLIAKSPRIR
ncbi:hypothetical protein LCGC14_3110410, partial [marine sediment metagenome]